MALPTPNDPIEKRIAVALVMTLTLPVWWPLLVFVFFLVWLLLGVAIGLMCVAAVVAPVFAVWGFEPDTHAELEVKVPLEREDEVKKALKDLGAKVSREGTTRA